MTFQFKRRWCGAYILWCYTLTIGCWDNRNVEERTLKHCSCITAVVVKSTVALIVPEPESLTKLQLQSTSNTHTKIHMTSAPTVHVYDYCIYLYLNTRPFSCTLDRCLHICSNMHTCSHLYHVLRFILFVVIYTTCSYIYHL